MNNPWISTKVKIPEQERKYIVAVKNPYGGYSIECCKFFKKGSDIGGEIIDRDLFAYWSDVWGYVTETDVEFWMEIPDLPS